MDREKKAAKLSEWTAAGNKGPLPPPLMDQMELPAFYRRDLGAEMAQALVNEEEAGRGRRTKAEVRYTDGLTDEQWANAVDASDDDVEDAVDRKRGRIARRQERKRLNEALEEAEADGKPLAATSIKVKQLQDVGEDTPGTGGKGKKRGRPSHSLTPSVQGDDFPTVCPLFILIDYELIFCRRRERSGRRLMKKWLSCDGYMRIRMRRSRRWVKT